MVSQNYHVRSQLDLTNEIQSCQAVVSQFEKMAEKKAEEIIGNFCDDSWNGKSREPTVHEQLIIIS